VILEHINSAKSSLFNQEIDSKNGWNFKRWLLEMLANWQALV
jgi:hypothetical protein